MTWNSKDLSLVRTPVGEMLSKALNISGNTAQVESNLLKAEAILPDTTVRMPYIFRISGQECFGSYK